MQDEQYSKDQATEEQVATLKAKLASAEQQQTELASKQGEGTDKLQTQITLLEKEKQNLESSLK